MIKFLPLVALLFSSFSIQEKMVKTKIGDSITMMIPNTLYPMSVDDIARRYPSVRKPLGAYTNDSRLADFSINVSATRWRSQDVAMAKDFFKASLFNLFDRVSMIQEEVKEINGKQYIVYEFDSRINGDPSSLESKDPIMRYNYVQYLLINGKTLVFGFNCHPRLKEEWQPVVEEMMASAKVKDNI